MSERKYSVAEIDRMRAAIRRTFPPQTYSQSINDPYLKSVGPDYSGQVEDRLRTYMLNGTEPEELEAMPPHWTNDVERLKHAPRPATRIHLIAGARGWGE